MYPDPRKQCVNGQYSFDLKTFLFLPHPAESSVNSAIYKDIVNSIWMFLNATMQSLRELM